MRIHHYGVENFGIDQADKYFNSFFDFFEIIEKQPFAFESVDYIKKGYRRCVCGVDSIYYRINNGTVEIMTIIGRQDITNIL
ncbi:MAG: type II toxin-antitoxin system RelE/ParE family toxin [Prolixibacteraceae bacterium]|nr:type II toxin-antitoxin system RelE/ParE family toxin [Prolixibacteraceae bacterium]